MPFPSDPDQAVGSTIQNPNQLFNLIGTFWQNYLTDANVLQNEEWSSLQLHADVYLRTIEMAAGLAVQQIQPFLGQQWRLIRLLQSELSGTANLIQYGGGESYGDGSVYGQIRANSYSWQLDTQIKNIGYLIDQVINPEVIFDVSNSYFDPDTSIISFASNPFTLVNSLPVYDSAGNIIDHQILLWARDIDIDIQQPWLRYGSIIKVPGQSNDDYVEILNAAWSMFCNGPSLRDFTRGLMASAGLRATVGNETVQVINVDQDGLCIVTDLNVYRFDAAATPLVTVGEFLVPDQSLTDTLQIIECGNGRTPDLSGLPGLACGPNLLNGVINIVVFPNINTTWSYINSDAQCTLYGDPTDIANFWNNVHANGVAAGKTLAEWLGVVSSGVVAVNPLDFVIDNFIGNSLVIVVLKPQHYLSFQTGFTNRLPSLMPAGTLFLFQIDISASTDIYQVSGTNSTPLVYPATVAPVDSISNGVRFIDLMPQVLVS